MARVYIPALLRPLCGGVSTLEVEAVTLEQALRAVDERCPGVYDRIVANGRLRPELNIALDGEMQDLPLFARVGPNAEIAVVPAMSGG